MKTKLLLMFMIVFLPNIYAQKTTNVVKWRSSELDTLTVAQAMFDDQNFVMAFPFLNQLQKNHPEQDFLKYMTGICCLFKEDTHKQGLDFLLNVYENNKHAEDIEFYIALAYHYNNDFENALVMVNKYMSKKHLSRAQTRGAERLKEYCLAGKTLIPAPDEGTLDDYVKLSLVSEN